MENTVKSKKKIVIIGARLDGHAGVILSTLREIGAFEVVGFIDNTLELQDKLLDGIPVIGSTDYLDRIEIPAQYVHIAIGDNVARWKFCRSVRDLGLRLVTIVHPSASVNKDAVIGEGCFIGSKAVVNNGVTIGDVSIINTGAIVEHDNKIGYAVHIAPGAKTAGRVRIDNCSFVGLGAVILPDIHIGSGVLIGAGSVVVSDVSSGTTMMGYAAKEHRRNIYTDIEPDVDTTQKVYVAQPTLPLYPLLDAKFRKIVESRMLSNFAIYSTQLELNIQRLLSVKRAMTFPNGTSALMLALKMLDLSGEVILPSFTFAATGHALLWNGLMPVFADIDPHTFNLDPDDVERRITDRTSAIMAVHIFGNPCEVSRLETIAKRYNLKLVFDSAHALGSKYDGRAIGGFGDIECFSLSGTKVITSAEGGIATSNDEALMERVSLGRNYGAGNDYNCHYIGLNGKMSEFHAAIAIESLLLLPSFIHARNEFAALYRERLSEIPGITFQDVSEQHVSTYKDIAILIDKEVFGMDRDELIGKLSMEGIFPKRYFYPPLHQMSVYQKIKCPAVNLENTERIANSIVCLPIYSHIKVDTLEKICYAVFRIWRNRNRGM